MSLKELREKSFNDTEAAVISAYLRLCADVGITHVTLQMIAKKAKLAFATVRYHFAEKQIDLEQAAFVYVVRRGQAITSAILEEERAKSSFNPLKAYLDGTFEWILNYAEEANFMLYFYYASATNKKMVFSHQEVLASAQLRVRALIHEGIGLGVYHPSKNVTVLAERIHAIILGSGVIAMSVGHPESYEKFRAQAWQSIQVLLD